MGFVGSKLGGNVRVRVGERSDLVGFLLKSVRDCGFVQGKDCPDTVGPEDRLPEMYSEILVILSKNYLRDSHAGRTPRLSSSSLRHEVNPPRGRLVSEGSRFRF